MSAALYAIGDIHGSLESLERLLDKIKLDLTQDRLLFVGDYIDRGPKSKEVVDHIIRLKNLSARLRRIDTEKTVLLDRLSKLSARQSAPRAAASLNASGPGLLGGFKFQY